MSNTAYTSDTIARRVREALGEFNDDDEAITVLVSRLAAEVRRLRRDANDVFECADGTVAKDASVAAQSWADECRRLRGAVATLTDQRDEARQLATQWSNEGGAEIARLREREARARKLAEKFIRSMDGATGTIGQAIAATEIRDGLRHWLETE